MIKQYPSFDKQKNQINSDIPPVSDLFKCLSWPSFDKDSYYNAAKDLLSSNPLGCSCSSSDRILGCKCSCKKISYHSTYKFSFTCIVNSVRKTVTLDRTVTDLDENGKPVTVRYEVPVYKCRIYEDPSTGKKAAGACRLYHSLSALAVPRYGRHTYRFIFAVLAEYRRILSGSSKGTVRKLCEAYGISVSTLYRWKEAFIEQYHFIASKLRPSDANRTVSFTLEKILAADQELVHTFFKTLRSVTFMEQAAWKHMQTFSS